MRTYKRKLTLAVIFALCLLLPVIAWAQFVAWESEPEQKSDVEPGDTIRYAFAVEEAAIANDWTALRVQLGSGLSLQKESIALELAKPPAASTSPEPSETAEPEAEDVQWEIVPGNDGFVVLLSALNAGDTVSFDATVKPEGQVSVTARTGTFSSELSHTLVIPPTPVPAPVQVVTPAPVAEQRPGLGVWQISLAVLITGTLGFLSLLGYRKIVLLKGLMQKPVESDSANAPEEQKKEQDVET